MSIPTDSVAPLGALNSTLSAKVSNKNEGTWDSLFQLLVASESTGSLLFADPVASISPANPLSQVIPAQVIPGLAVTGRNMALADPESAYKMMTLINKMDVTYQAQYAELDQMRSAVAQIQDAAQNLTGTGNIKLQLLGFVTQYNNWVARFNPDMQQSGLLAGTQAAQVSRYELEQNIQSPFLGVGDGIKGMAGLGITIDPHTHLATLDITKLDALLASNKAGVVNTVQEFGASFAKSASLLASDGNFLSRQLDNLHHAVDYISANSASLQQEFGTGDASTTRSTRV